MSDSLIFHSAEFIFGSKKNLQIRVTVGHTASGVWKWIVAKWVPVLGMQFVGEYEMIPLPGEFAEAAISVANAEKIIMIMMPDFKMDVVAGYIMPEPGDTIEFDYIEEVDKTVRVKGILMDRTPQQMLVELLEPIMFFKLENPKGINLVFYFRYILNLKKV